MVLNFLNKTECIELGYFAYFDVDMVQNRENELFTCRKKAHFLPLYIIYAC